MDSFDWKYYLENNSDLTENGILTQEDAFNHWEMFGKTENRTHKYYSNFVLESYFKKIIDYVKENTITKIDAWDILEIIYNKNNSTTIEESNIEIELDNFDWKFYIEKNNDLRNSGILTKDLALKHWVERGKFENRKFKAITNNNITNITFDNFDWKFYITHNLDLIENNIITKDQSWSHWINYGRYEDREINTFILEKNDLNEQIDGHITNTKQNNTLKHIEETKLKSLINIDNNKFKNKFNLNDFNESDDSDTVDSNSIDTNSDDSKSDDAPELFNTKLIKKFYNEEIPIKKIQENELFDEKIIKKNHGNIVSDNKMIKRSEIPCEKIIKKFEEDELYDENIINLDERMINLDELHDEKNINLEELSYREINEKKKSNKIIKNVHGKYSLN